MIFLLQWELINIYFLNGIFFSVKAIFLLQWGLIKIYFFDGIFFLGKVIFLLQWKLINAWYSAVQRKLTLDSLSLRESSRESTLDSRLLCLNSRFLQDLSNRKDLFTNDYKGFLFQVICQTLLSILNWCENLNLCSSFEQSSNFSHVKKNLSTL